MGKFCNVIYFKHFVENSLESFFRENTNNFTVDDNGLIVFSKRMSFSSLKRDLRGKIQEEILKYVRPYDVTHREYFLILGSCYPKDNFLVKHIDRNKYFPEKIWNYIERGNIKYFLKVDGIKIDVSYFNSVIDSIFDDFFRRKNFKKMFPRNVENLFFVKHSNFDCYMMYRVVKKLFGKINVCNMFAENSDKMKENLYSVNKKIDYYVSGIKEILETGEMKAEVEEINYYLKNCVGLK